MDNQTGSLVGLVPVLKKSCCTIPILSSLFRPLCLYSSLSVSLWAPCGGSSLIHQPLQPPCSPLSLWKLNPTPCTTLSPHLPTANPPLASLTTLCHQLSRVTQAILLIQPTAVYGGTGAVSSKPPPPTHPPGHFPEESSMLSSHRQTQTHTVSHHHSHLLMPSQHQSCLHTTTSIHSR